MKKKPGSAPSNIDRETWHQIVKASEALFLARGYKGVSMKDIADVVQVTPAALYYHFPRGKEDLFLSVVQVMFEEWAVGIDQAVVGARDIRECLHLLTAYLVTLPVSHIALLVRDTHEQLKDLDRRQGMIGQVREAFEEHLIAIFQRMKDAREIRADIPVHMIARMYIGMIMSLLQNGPFSPKESESMQSTPIASMLISVLLDGIASQEQRSKQ
jgi:AcrR family transcriptional regulator